MTVNVKVLVNIHMHAVHSLSSLWNGNIRGPNGEGATGKE